MKKWMLDVTTIHTLPGPGKVYTFFESDKVCFSPLIIQFYTFFNNHTNSIETTFQVNSRGNHIV